MLTRRREILAPGRRADRLEGRLQRPRRSRRSSASTRRSPGFLTTDGLLADGDLVDRGRRPVVVESEVAVELGDDGRSIVALLPALEIADPPDLDLDDRADPRRQHLPPRRAFGPRVETGAPGAAPHPRERRGAAHGAGRATGAHLEAMVEAVAARLAAAGEELRPGERIITGDARPAARARRRATPCGSSSTHWGAWSSAFRSIRRHEHRRRHAARRPLRRRPLVRRRPAPAADRRRARPRRPTGAPSRRSTPPPASAIAEVPHAGAEDVDRAVRGRARGVRGRALERASRPPSAPARCSPRRR